MRSPVRFQVLPWGLFLEGEDSHGDHGPAVAYRGGRGGLGISNPLPKFRSFDKAEPNSQFRGKYIQTT
jgi:hypothetical protein